MNLNWSNKVIKYVLFVFNLLFVISGIIMIAVGVSVKEYYTDYDIFLSNRYFSLPNLLIAIGSLIFFISFFGCCGAIRESWFMIFVFSILLSIIFIMELSAGIAGYVLRDDTAEYLQNELTVSMKKYNFTVGNLNPIVVLWDTMQTEFQCCGVKGPNDWSSVYPPPTSELTTVTSASSPLSTESSSVSTVSTSITTVTTSSTPEALDRTSETPSSIATNRRKQTQSDKIGVQPDSKSFNLQTNRTSRDTNTQEPKQGDLPFSCCLPKHGTAGDVSCNLITDTATYHTKGCVAGFGDYVRDHAVTIGGVGIAIALIQLFGVIFACHLTRQLKNGFYST